MVEGRFLISGEVACQELRPHPSMPEMSSLLLSEKNEFEVRHCGNNQRIEDSRDVVLNIQKAKQSCELLYLR